jgi:hypothetical protein
MGLFTNAWLMNKQVDGICRPNARRSRSMARSTPYSCSYEQLNVFKSCRRLLHIACCLMHADCQLPSE